MMKNWLVLPLFLMACGTGPCREVKKSPNPGNVAEVSMKQSSPNDRVKVYKSDGTIQCEKTKPIPLETMAKELGGITIFSSENKHDGMMRIQQCGTPTGQANVYEINRSDLEAARKAGFQEWTWD